jgi:hypothetical protein
MCGFERYVWFTKNVERCCRTAGLRYMWTLTYNREGLTAAESWEGISKAWDRFKTTMVRRHGAVRYIWVVEPQKSGHAHLHVVVDKFWEHAEVSELWGRYTGGSDVVWVSRPNTRKAARYLAKYMVKSFGYDVVIPGIGALWHRRRFGKSRSLEFLPFAVSSGGWYVRYEAYKQVRRELLGRWHLVNECTEGFPWVRVLPASWARPPPWGPGQEVSLPVGQVVGLPPADRYGSRGGSV